MKNLNSQTVKVFDFGSQQFGDIPAAELASGMIQASVEGQTCFIDPQQTKPALLKGPFFHPPFDKAFRGKFRRLHGVFKDVYPISLKEWEDGFRRDMHPLPQIESWLYRAEVFEEALELHDLELAQKKELFCVILQCATCPYEQIANVVSVDKLPREIMNATIQRFYGEPELKKQASLLPSVEYPDPSGSTPRPAEKLLDPAERKLLKDVDIIYGVDSYTGKSSVFWGLKLLKEIVETGKSVEVKTISYLYDSRTNQLEMIDVAVTLVKGSSDYTSQ